MQGLFFVFWKIMKHMKLIKVCGFFSKNPETHEVDKSMRVFRQILKHMKLIKVCVFFFEQS